MKKIKVNRGACIKCGACYYIDEKHLEPDEEGVSTVINEVVDENDTSALEAMESCPTNAISIVEEKEEDNILETEV